MDQDIANRFAEIDEILAETEERLRTVARQNAALAEMVEVLGPFTAVNIDTLAQRLREQHGEGPT